MTQEELRKLQQEMKELKERINRYSFLFDEVKKINDFLQSFLVLMVELMILDNSSSRLCTLIKGVSKNFPKSFLEIYIGLTIEKAKKVNMDFGTLADILMEGLGERIKELKLSDVIRKVYGFQAAERWRKVLEESDSKNPVKGVIRFGRK